DVDLPVDSGETAQLLGHDPPLELALVARAHVLEVAAPAPAGAGHGAPRVHAVLGRLEDRHGVRPEEPVARPPFGDPHARPLPGEGVAHEEHPPLVPGHAVPSVRDGADLDLDLVTDDQVIGSHCSRVRVHAPPRRTSPATGPSMRSSAPAELASCHGTEETMTPGVKINRLRSRSADWLCRTCSHQCPSTYCGMYTTTRSRGLPERIDFTCSTTGRVISR